ICQTSILNPNMDPQKAAFPTIVHIDAESQDDSTDDGPRPWNTTLETVRQFIQDHIDQDFISSEDASKLFQLIIDALSSDAVPDLNTLNGLYDLCNISCGDQLISALCFLFQQ